MEVFFKRNQRDLAGVLSRKIIYFALRKVIFQSIEIGQWFFFIEMVFPQGVCSYNVLK
jgi:hypothetical protein